MQASFGFLNPLFRLWGPHFCEQDPSIYPKHPHIFLKGRKAHKIPPLSAYLDKLDG